MRPEPRILAVGASPRGGGNSDALLGRFRAGAERQGVEVEVVQLRELDIHPCVGCEACRKDGVCGWYDDEMNELAELVRRCRGLFTVSPVHHYNVTAWMKAFIDRLYPFYDFADERPGRWSSRFAGEGRVAVVGAVAEQPYREDMGCTLEAMRRPLEALGYRVVCELAVLGVFEAGAVRDRPDALAEAEACGRALAEAVRGEPPAT